MRRWIATVIAAVVLVAACGQPPVAPDPEAEEPAIVEPVAGQESLNRITLTQRAVERLGIETVEVVAAPGVGQRVRVPYSAVIYSADGDAWGYVVDGSSNVFLRQALTVEEIVVDTAGDYAVLTAGPQVGMAIVSVGVAELFGTESGVGH